MRTTLLIIFFIFYNIFTGYSLDYYWVNGSGDWSDINHWATSSGGNLKHIQTPTPSDNVYFDANSSSSAFTVNMNTPVIVCRDLNLSGLDDSLIFSSVVNDLRLYGGLALSKKVNWNIQAKFSFESQQTGNQISSNHCSMPFDLYFQSPSGGWILTDTFYSTFNIFHLSGSFSTNGFSVRVNSYKSISTLSRTLILGASNLVLNVFDVLGQGFMVNAGTSHILVKSGFFQTDNCAAQTFYNITFPVMGQVINYSTNLTFHDVVCQKNASFFGNTDFNILFLTKGYFYSFASGSIYRFFTNLVANGDCKKTISIASNPATASFIKNSGAININYVLLKNIVASGGASFNAFSSVDLGGNSGWNIQATLPRTLYWVGGSGYWEDSTHWSLSSGGVGGECIPTLKDNVIFNNSSFNGFGNTVQVIDTAGNCHDMTWTTNKFPVLMSSMNKILRISGSMYWCSDMVNGFLGDIVFVSKDLGEFVQTANHRLNQNLAFDGFGGWTLLDTISTDFTIALDRGRLNTNNQYIRAFVFTAATDKWKELFMTNSLFEIDVNFTIRQDSTFINPGHSTVKMLDSNAVVRTSYLPHRYLWNVIFENFGLLDVNRTHFNKIIYRNSIIKRNILTTDSIYYSAGCDYRLSGVDTVKNYLYAYGYCTKKITWRSEHPMGTFYLYKNSGNISVNRVHMRGIHAQGNANFLAVNSSNLGKNNGWVFNNIGADLYWIGNSGDWNDSLHWSFSSGGVGGACIPTINDNVFFDLNSFSGANNVVVATTPNIFCRNMNWSNAIPSSIFSTSNFTNLWISGSVDLSSSVNFDYYGYVYFCDSSVTKHIRSASNDFDSVVFFIDNGLWQLSDSMSVRESIIHYTGRIHTLGKKLSMGTYNAGYIFPKGFNISGSEVLIKYKLNGLWIWNHNPTDYFTATNSNVRFYCSSNQLILSGAGQVNFHNIFFQDPFSQSLFQSTSSINNYNKKVHFYSSGTINGDHSYDTLIFSAGKQYLLKSNNTQTILHHLDANGYCSKIIRIIGSGGNSTIYKSNGLVEVNDVALTSITAQGNAVFNAYGGLDNGFNVNWNFFPNASRTLYWVGGDGDWTDSSHWSLSSGGPGGECIPTKIDDVIIDSNSVITKYFSNMNIATGSECRSLLWKDVVGTSVSGFLDIHGALNLSTQINTQSLLLNFLSDMPANLIRTSGNFIRLIQFNGKGGWYLFDNLLVMDSIVFAKGFLDTRGKDISTTSFFSISGAERKLNMSNSTIVLKKNWQMNNDSLWLIAYGSDIYFNDITVNNSYKFISSGKGTVNYYNLTVLDERIGKTFFFNHDTANINFNKVKVYNDGIFYNYYTFDTLIFAPGNTYKLQHGMTQYVNKQWIIRGNNCYAINLESTKMYSEAYVYKPDGIVSGDFINMRDNYATGACTFYAGGFSTNINNNSKWLFTNGPNYVYGLGPDTNFTLGSNVVINTTNFNGTENTLYLWNTGSTNDTIVVSQTGWYWVTVTYASDCQVVDSIYVGCKINLDFIINNNPCFGDSLGAAVFIVPDSSYMYSYIWNTGDTSRFIYNKPAGSYILTVIADSGHCKASDTIHIIDPPKIIVPQSDTSFCESDSVLLILGNFAKYNWSDGYNFSTRWVGNPDTFYVYVEDFNGCKSDLDTIHVQRDSIPYMSLGLDTLICLNQQILLNPGVGFDSYYWFDGRNDSVFIASYPGVYWVTIQRKSCFITDSILLETCPPILKMPNVFTPNGDGFNDNFLPEQDNIVHFKMYIYNRWGMQIYQTDDLQKGWDGTTLGLEASDGVYFYLIEYREWLGHQASDLITAQGTVTLIRHSSP